MQFSDFSGYLNIFRGINRLEEPGVRSCVASVCPHTERMVGYRCGPHCLKPLSPQSLPEGGGGFGGFMVVDSTLCHLWSPVVALSWLWWHFLFGSVRI